MRLEDGERVVLDGEEVRVEGEEVRFCWTRAARTVGGSVASSEQSGGRRAHALKAVTRCRGNRTLIQSLVSPISVHTSSW